MTNQDTKFKIKFAPGKTRTYESVTVLDEEAMGKSFWDLEQQLETLFLSKAILWSLGEAEEAWDWKEGKPVRVASAGKI